MYGIRGRLECIYSPPVGFCRILPCVASISNRETHYLEECPHYHCKKLNLHQPHPTAKLANTTQFICSMLQKKAVRYRDHRVNLCRNILKTMQDSK